MANGEVVYEAGHASEQQQQQTEKNKTVFNLLNNRYQPSPKGRSLARVSFQIGLCWSLMTLLSYVRPRTYQICTHVMAHISHYITP